MPSISNAYIIMNQILQNENNILLEIISRSLEHACVLWYKSYFAYYDLFDMKLTMNPNLSARIPIADQISRMCTIKIQRKELCKVERE